MAGRGRGRGQSNMISINFEALGISRAELLSQSQNASPPKRYPPLARPPVPVKDVDPGVIRRVEIKRRMMVRFRKLAATLTLEDKKRDIERYSDKYQLSQQEEVWTPDYSQFPDELRPAEPQKRKRITVQPNLKAARKSTSTTTTAEILARTKKRLTEMETVEDAPMEDEEEKKEEEEEEKEEEGGEEEEEEEDFDEEETDYNQSYFDNGEGYGDDEDEDDEPSYS